MSGPRWGHPDPWSLHATVYGFLFSNPWRLIKGKQDVPSVKSDSHLKLMKTLLCYSVTSRSLPIPHSLQDGACQRPQDMHFRCLPAQY